MKPKILVLILSYNGKYLLEECISSYMTNNYANYELVVVDNGSTDGTKEYVESNFPTVYVCRTDKNLKYSGGLNFGMQYAFTKTDADYVLITNNDVKADSKIVEELVSVAVSDSTIGFTIGKVYYYDSPNVFQTVGKKMDPVLWNGGHIGHKETDNGQHDEVCERAWCDDIYWLVKKEVWEKTGGYDTEFAFQGEDFDWQVRAKKLGYKIMYAPKAKLWHKESMTIGKMSPFKAYFDARNPLIIHMKYREKREYIYMVKLRFKQHLQAVPRQIIKGKFKLLFKTWQGFGSALIWGFKNKRLP